MKAISLTQPWATLVAIGAKKYETRSWSTNYRGPLAIHAAKGYPRSAQYLAQETQPFRDVLNRPNEELPRGAIIAIVELTGCIHTEDFWNLTEQERAFGDYGPRRYAWQLTNVRELQYPVPCKGALGLWTVPDEVMAKVLADAAMVR